MQVERLQRVQEELLAARQRVEPLQKRQQTELLKDKADKAVLKDLEEAIAPPVAEQQQLLDERKLLETQPQGEQWGTAPDAWLVLGPSGILGPEDRWPPEFPGSGGGCSGPPAGLNSTLAFTCWAVLQITHLAWVYRAGSGPSAQVRSLPKGQPPAVPTRISCTLYQLDKACFF